MIIKFEVENYLSFKERVSFDFVSADIKEHLENVYQTEQVGVLKSAVLYGANASGKSNVLRALYFLCDFILHGHRFMGREDSILRYPYQLDSKYEKLPTFMSISVLDANDNIYEYSIKFNDNEILNEEFKIFDEKKQGFITLFKRSGAEVEEIERLGEGALIEVLIRGLMHRNGLFLSTLNSSNLDNKSIVSFISEIEKYNFINVREDFRNFGYSRDITGIPVREIHRHKELNDLDYLGKINCLIKASDVDVLGIDTRVIETIDYEGEVRKRIKLISKHSFIDAEESEVEKEFDFSSFESEGTGNLLKIAPYIVDVLDNDGVIIFDELDASFHPLLTQMIVKLMNSGKANKHAQMIFTAHDISLIDSHTNIFRRDQIYFCEKVNGASTIYSLFDIKRSDNRAVRSDTNYAKNYIRGKYKAVPMIKDIGSIYADFCAKKKEGDE